MLNYFRCHDGKVEHFTSFRAEMLTEHPKALHWIDIEDPTPEEAAILTDPFHFHPLAIEDCLTEVHHPKLDDYEDYVFFIVHGIRFDAPTDQFITRELDIFLGPDYLITHHRGPMRSINSAMELCGRNLLQSFGRGVDFLVHHILDQMFDHYFPNLDAIEDKIQLVQVEVFENPDRPRIAVRPRASLRPAVPVAPGRRPGGRSAPDRASRKRSPAPRRGRSGWRRGRRRAHRRCRSSGPTAPPGPS